MYAAVEIYVFLCVPLTKSDTSILSHIANRAAGGSRSENIQ